MKGDHATIPAVVSGFAEGERDLSSEHVHCRLACCKPVIYFFWLQCLVPTASFSRAKKDNNNNYNNDDFVTMCVAITAIVSFYIFQFRFSNAAISNMQSSV